MNILVSEKVQGTQWGHCMLSFVQKNYIIIAVGVQFLYIFFIT